MRILLLIILVSIPSMGQADPARQEYCFLSQDAFQDSKKTVNAFLRSWSQYNAETKMLRATGNGYTVYDDPNLKMCFSFKAYQRDLVRLDKQVEKFRLKYNEKEIFISDRLSKKIVPFKLTETGTSRAFKQYWQLNKNLDLFYDPVQGKEIKLRYAKHYHQTEGTVHGLEKLKKNRHLASSILTIRAQYLHERLIRIDFELDGRKLSITRGSRGGIYLKEVMNWYSEDSFSPVYSFYPADKFSERDGVMLFQAGLETLD